KHLPPAGAKVVVADVRSESQQIAGLLAGQHYDAVVDFIAFTVQDIERDLALFRGNCAQFVFISSASAYEKPPRHYLITEKTRLENPYWQYSRDKIDCEARLMRAFDEEAFPITIVRPSLTYGPSQIPLCVNSWAHPWTIIDRMRRGGKIIVPGDGTSLWVVTWNADFAGGLLGLLGKPEAIGEVFQITSDEVHTWDQLHLEAFNLLGLEPNILHVPADLIAAYWPHAMGSLIGDKIHSVVFDNGKIKKLVPDFQCQVNWAQGLRTAIQWHGAHPEFQTVDTDLARIMDEIVRGYERARPQA
ncbi:MAG TPA: NAD-dependent epimerase/dehydratase family protein, partial [Anaerolineales bacterium]